MKGICLSIKQLGCEGSPTLRLIIQWQSSGNLVCLEVSHLRRWNATGEIIFRHQSVSSGHPECFCVL